MSAITSRVLEPYVPSTDAPWTEERVVHLHRRAGFAATWDEIQRDLAEGPEASLARFFSGTVRDDHSFERRSRVILDHALSQRGADLLRAWWLWQMIFTPDPLGERLTLMWHDHFATGLRKVRSVTAMHRQNALFREHSRGPFANLLRPVAKDPALLLWLDAPANRKGSPNENLARELLELFTLGIGHYSEDDVKETARALTGWTVDDGEFFEFAPDHDDGVKTILGMTAAHDGNSVLDRLLEHPATAKRLAWRIASTFLGGKTVEDAVLEPLARGLRARELDVGWAVETVLRSETFFAAEQLRARVLDPVGFCVGAVRAFDLFERPPSTSVLADWTRRLGMDLLDPPNVGGWPGGRTWLATRHVLGRVKFASGLLAGRPVGLRGPVDVEALLARHDPNCSDVAAHLGRLLHGREPQGALRQRLERAMHESNDALSPSDDGERARQVAALLLASPESQLA